MAEKSKHFDLTDESIDILASKIHELEFEDLNYKLKVYSCRQCNMIAIKHRIANCQHVFCHECYAIYYGQQCPVCKTVITGSTLDDKYTKAVLNFKVSCEFKRNGCQTVVQLGDFLVHTKYCSLATKRLLPKLYKVDPHLEALEQSLRKEIGKMKNEIQDLQAENKQLKDALKENANQMTKVTTGTKEQKFEIRKIKKTITSIENLFHDNLNACVANTERLTNDLQSQIDLIEIKPAEFLKHYRRYVLGKPTLLRDLNAEGNSSDSLDTSFDWTITGVRQKLEKCKKGRSVFAESEEFSIPSHGLKFRAKLERSVSESRMLISLHFTSKPSADSRPFLHSRKFVLVDRSKDHEGRQDFVWMNEPYFGQNCTEQILGIWLRYNRCFPVSLLEDRDKYVKNDEILIRIILEPIAKMFKRVSSMDGTILVRIDNYTKRKQEAVNGIKRILTSESFYTSAKGFRMDVDIFLNGFGTNEGKCISIMPMFRIGEWDDSHSFPIKCKYRRFLMDQSDARTKENISYESGVRKYERYYVFDDFADLMSHKDVEKFRYLKDDSLLIKIVIEIVDT